MRKSAIVILGATGDLARRKLIPSLEVLYRQGQIAKDCLIVGSGRRELSHAEFLAHVRAPADMASNLHYHQGIPGLKKYLESRGAAGSVIIFLALPPNLYADTAAKLKAEGFGSEIRLIVEKPFGYNLKSARELNQRLTENFQEHQIYRIDHYLAKEAVQNILVFRFANSLLYPVWNSGYIESIQIEASEELGVESRGAYFDRSGVIRDMVQNHLIQMLALLTMEVPVSLNADDIRVQKINILKALEVTRYKRGQYEGYRREKMVAADSTTETFVEMELHIKNFRWDGMPVYIRTGKALGSKGTRIGIRFKSIPKLLFNAEGDLKSNHIIFHVQPATGIVIGHSVKMPGTEQDIVPSQLEYSMSEMFGNDLAANAYQRLLLDALNGDRTLYVSADEAELAWDVLDDVLDAGELFLYRRGEMPRSPLGIEWIDFSEYDITPRQEPC